MTQECPVCGQSFGLTHTCPGAPSAANPPTDEWPVPKRFAPLFYLRQAIAIARFEDAAIRGASRDERAIVYGIAFWLIARIAIYGKMYALPKIRPYLAGYEVSWANIAFAIAVFVVIDMVYFLIQYGVSHGLARLFLHAQGTYVGILRAMFLGSIVSLALVIPYVGGLIGSLWMMALLMRVFEEVDKIERMKAFALAAATGVAFWLLAVVLMTPRH